MCAMDDRGVRVASCMGVDRFKLVFGRWRTVFGFEQRGRRGERVVGEWRARHDEKFFRS
jgi:thiamine phosphate synthase YjbQ (UPF0047 family)